MLKSKHIEIDAHFVHDQVLANRLQICHIASHEQIVDCLTKSLSQRQHQFLRDKLDLWFSTGCCY